MSMKKKKLRFLLPFKNNYNNCLTRNDGILNGRFSLFLLFAAHVAQKVQGLSMEGKKNSSVDQMLRFILML